ncbi:unnamed protein product [Colias eurytheme]|nr:unnamed protein product [Colias eurytheme]
MIWGRFVEDPTFTVVESLHYATENIPFSAVALCDPEVYGPSTVNITNILSLRGFKAKEIADFYRSFTDVVDKNYTPELHVIKMHNVLEDLGLAYDDLSYQLKKPCDVMLRECLWRSKPVNCSMMFREVFTINGHCCQFDINYFKQFAENGTNFNAGVEITEAIDISVDTRKVHPNGTFGDGFVMLYIFDEMNTLSLLDSSIILTPSTYFDVTVDVWIIDSSSDVKALTLNSRKCFLEADGMHSSSYQHCVTSFILKKVVDYCRCLPFDLSRKLFEEDFPRCTWEKLLCVYQILAKVQGDIRTIVSANDCYQKCDYVQYETKAEYIREQRALGGYGGLSRVTVHYANNICIKYRREVLYTWDQMLANLGGIFGLCLGGSIISLMELVWFLLDLITAVYHNITKNKTGTKQVCRVKEKSGLQDVKKSNDNIKYPFIH